MYVHSMLALFDDEYAVVGSANVTHRSMQRDGECDIGVADPVQAKAIREAVFGHWG